MLHFHAGGKERDWAVAAAVALLPLRCCRCVVARCVGLLAYLLARCPLVRRRDSSSVERQGKIHIRRRGGEDCFCTASDDPPSLSAARALSCFFLAFTGLSLCDPAVLGSISMGGCDAIEVGVPGGARCLIWSLAVSRQEVGGNGNWNGNLVMFAKSAASSSAITV